MTLFIVVSNINAETIEDGRVWLNFNAQGSIANTNFNWYSELQSR